MKSIRNKKIKWLSVILLGILLAGCVYLSGCGDDKAESDYQLYYVNYDKGVIESEDFIPDSERKEDMIEEISRKIGSGDEGVGLLPKGVSLLNYELIDDILLLNFNAAYRKMGNVDEILCRAAIVKNFLQMEDVTYIKITIEGEELQDSRGNAVGIMGSNSFLENSGKDITAYQYTEMELYFANETGDKLVKEKRKVYYTSNSPIEKVIVEQLIRGPRESGHFATISSGTGILSVSQADGIAYVNLDQRFVTEALGVQPEVTVYSIVNSLIAAGNVKRVQISVNGDSKVEFKESVELNQLYEANNELVENDTGNHVENNARDDVENDSDITKEEENVSEESGGEQ